MINLGYSIFLILWTVLFIEFWKRKQSAYAVHWGTEGCEENEEIRPEFKGELKEHRVTGKV